LLVYRPNGWYTGAAIQDFRDGVGDSKWVGRPSVSAGQGDDAMKGALLGTCLVFGLAQIALPPQTHAAEVPQLGANATSDELIDALTPKPGAQAMKFRGLHLLTANPSTGKQGPMPAVGLDIKFEINSARLSDESKQTIRQLATAIRSPQLGKYHFLIEGHTDSTGRKDHNLVLSRMRAEAVRNELVSVYAVERDHLEAVGRGQTQPLNPADPANPANRRVQVVNIGQ
jgi:OOP family OmpA-OmpF porin